MYLLINDTRHTVSRRIVTKDTIKYLSVTPEPGTVSGTIQVYRDDGFLMAEDNADGFERQQYIGTLLTLTNKPEPIPVDPTTTDSYRIATLESENKLLTQQVEALSGQMDFQEECIVEMAGIVYA